MQSNIQLGKIEKEENVARKYFPYGATRTNIPIFFIAPTSDDSLEIHRILFKLLQLVFVDVYDAVAFALLLELSAVLKP